MTSSAAANESSTATPIDPRDWATLCQSELAGLAVDREFAEGLAAATDLWNAAAAGGPGDPAGRPGADAPPGTAPAGVAPDAGELAELRRRLAELERRSAP